MSSLCPSSPAHKIMSPLDSTSSSSNSIVDTKPVSNAIPLALDTSSASTPTNHQSVANKIQLEGEATTSKEVLEVKCPIDVEETTTVATPRKEIAMGSKENDQKIVSAKINRKWSQEFDQHVKKNKREKRRRGNRENPEERLPIGFV